MSKWVARAVRLIASVVLVCVFYWQPCAADAPWTVVGQDPGADFGWRNDGRAIIREPALRTPPSGSSEEGASSVLLYTAQTWGDHALGGRFLAQGAGSFGFIIRYQDPGNYYRFVLVNDREEGGSYAQIDKCVDGRLVVLARKEWAFTPGQWYTIGFGAVDDFLCVQVADEFELTAVDGTFSRGKIGLLCRGPARVRFETLNVSTDGQTTTLLPLGIDAPATDPPSTGPLIGGGVLG